MCGFAVAIDWPDAVAVVDQLLQGIRHRGDITDPIVSPRRNTAMATRRLRIVDAEHAIQPQISYDGRLLVCFNGEIYNYRELRRELILGGVPFQTESDTEVLSNALRVWGERALERLVGMYAFVAVDAASGAFLAARDPYGIKPLYLIQGETGICFCSEIRPLLEAVEKGEVLMVPPGHLLTSSKCVQFGLPGSGTRLATGPKVLDRLLSEAVHKRLPPDLPVATMLSGGIDSTLIAHYTREFRPDAPGYFVGGTDAPDYPYAAAYAESSGLDLRLVPLDLPADKTGSLIDHLVQTTEAFEPNLIRVAACSLAVADQMSRDGFRVALCGEGADELFCGYPPLEIAFGEKDPAASVLRDECLGLMHRVSLQRVDRCSMRHQIETREPFLDPTVARYALSLDADELVCQVGGMPIGKAPLREVYDLYPGRLPKIIRDRTKMPFGEGAGLNVSPVGSNWKQFFEEIISDADLLDGKLEFLAYNLQSKEELFYLLSLSRCMDIARVPHLQSRAWISFPMHQYRSKLEKYDYFSL